MNTALFLITSFTLLLFSLLNVVYLNITVDKHKQFAINVYYGMLSVLIIAILLVFVFIQGFSNSDRFLIFSVAFFGNPLIFVFPISTIWKKISCRLKRLFSKFFMVFYGIILLFGLLGMTFPANTWGNSTIIYGITLTIWSLPNILLATVMTKDYRFAGISRIAIGSLSLINISITMAHSDYNGNFENSMKMISFLTGIYFIFEGYLFIAKYKKTTNG
jgi:hypothetical protein